MLNELSVDMIRLSTRVDDKYFETHAKAWIALYITPEMVIKTSFIGNLKYWESTKAMNYRYNFTYTDEYEKSFYFAYKHNSEKATRGKHNFVVEYNPNKVNNTFLKMILETFILNKDERKVKDLTIVSADVCIDFPINIVNCIIDSNGKRDFASFGSTTTDDKTYYMGKGNGRIKLYNKKQELLKKHGTYVAGELTRYEVSLEIKTPIGQFQSYDMKCMLPKLTFYQQYLLTDVEDKLLLLGLTQAPELLNQLPRRKKEKLKKILESQAQFEFKENEIKICITNYINKLKENQ